MAHPETHGYSPADGTLFEVAPQRGCNVFRWQVGGHEVLYRPTDFPAKGRYSAGGNPILFPAVGRTWDFSTEPVTQDQYQLAGAEAPLRMPIHGILAECSFRRETVGQDAQRTDAIYRLRIPESVRDSCYPFPVEMHVELSMEPAALGIAATMVNQGDHPAPYAFGTHPYFRISNPHRRGVSLELPASAQLELDPNTLTPTGRTLSLEKPFQLEAETSYDTVLTGLTAQHAVLTDREAGHRVRISYDSALTSLVIYSPAGSDFICVEPWTAGLGGFATLKDPGWRERPATPVLPPGQTRTVAIRYSLEPL